MNKEIKYIPGDLVMTNGIPIGTKKGSVYQVTESNPDKYRNHFTGDIEVRVNPAKKDGTRSNREFVLWGMEVDSIKKIN